MGRKRRMLTDENTLLCPFGGGHEAHITEFFATIIPEEDAAYAWYTVDGIHYGKTNSYCRACTHAYNKGYPHTVKREAEVAKEREAYAAAQAEKVAKAKQALVDAWWEEQRKNKE